MRKVIAVLILATVGLVATVVVLLRNARKAQATQKPPTFEVKCFGGPCDGHTHEVHGKDGKRNPFYVTRYIRTDEDGMPLEEDFRGEFMGMQMYSPSLAYYRQVEGSDYFYVRDITQEEAAALMRGEILDAIGDDE
jgi:hypothetical protein